MLTVDICLKKNLIALLSKPIFFNFQANEDQEDLDERNDADSDMEMDDPKHFIDTSWCSYLLFFLDLFLLFFVCHTCKLAHMHACVHACSKPLDGTQNKKASMDIVENEVMGQVITVLTFPFKISL